jgi:hypothetical protein
MNCTMFKLVLSEKYATVKHLRLNIIRESVIQYIFCNMGNYMLHIGIDDII